MNCLIKKNVLRAVDDAAPNHDGKVLVHFPSEETGMVGSRVWCTPRGRPLRGAAMSEVHVPVFRASIKCPSAVTTLRP